MVNGEFRSRPTIGQRFRGWTTAKFDANMDSVRFFGVSDQNWRKIWKKLIEKYKVWRKYRC